MGPSSAEWARAGRFLLAAPGHLWGGANLALATIAQLQLTEWFVSTPWPALTVAGILQTIAFGKGFLVLLPPALCAAVLWGWRFRAARSPRPRGLGFGNSPVGAVGDGRRSLCFTLPILSRPAAPS